MNADERRQRLIKILKSSNEPLKGGKLAEMLSVSRQVIVQDIAIIRAKGFEIIATSQGYIVYDKIYIEKTIKCKNHKSPQEIYDELKTIVDMGGTIKDVIANHPTYGEIKTDLNIESNRDINEFMDKVAKNEFKQLSTLTEHEHIHTITAKNEDIINDILDELDKKKILSE